MEYLIIKSALAELTPDDFTHPGLRIAKFVFCDDQPNQNGVGIEKEDFPAIIKSAIGTPLKMKFLGENVAGHAGSIPVGFISQMYEQQAEDGSNQLVALATLFADDYPDEVQWIHDKLHSGNLEDVPGVSWELSYKEDVLKQGIKWLKGIITRAATIVKDPAYGKRTAILALASNQNISEEQLLQQVSEVIKEDSPKIEAQGGNNNMEKELEELQQKVADLEGQIQTLNTTVSEKDTEIETLTNTVAERDATISEYTTKELIASRTSELVEAGISLPTESDKLAKKQALIAGMTEEAFASYKEDLVETLGAATAANKNTTNRVELAEKLQPTRLPRFVAASKDDSDGPVDLKDLKHRLSRQGRLEAAEDSEE